MTASTQLLIIDPQNDFCDLPESWCPTDPVSGARTTPALPVAGAHADLQRLAAFIRDAGDTLDDITVTLDSHNRLHIAHPTFWQRGDGGDVAPFTAITAADLRAGTYRTRDAAAQARALQYVEALEARGRYVLMVWPVHCEIGSWGHGVHPAVRAAYNAWEVRQLKVVRKVAKGSNLWTEHYSALQAEVPDPSDPDTLLNQGLLGVLERADTLIVAGEAGSHCVKSTVEDLADQLPEGRADHLVLLTDCMSPVTGFHAQHDAFLKGMAARGARLATSTEVLATLRNR
jgi:nicotinamidase-related amidase